MDSAEFPGQVIFRGTHVNADIDRWVIGPLVGVSYPPTQLFVSSRDSVRYQQVHQVWLPHLVAVSYARGYNGHAADGVLYLLASDVAITSFASMVAPLAFPHIFFNGQVCSDESYELLPPLSWGAVASGRSALNRFLSSPFSYFDLGSEQHAEFFPTETPPEVRPTHTHERVAPAYLDWWASLSLEEILGLHYPSRVSLGKWCSRLAENFRIYRAGK